jgi:hypothetical protein
MREGVAVAGATEALRAVSVVAEPQIDLDKE